MTLPLDQIFVLSKHWLLSFVPPIAQPLASAILSVVPVLIAFPLLFAITTLLERTARIVLDPGDCSSPSPTESSRSPRKISFRSPQTTLCTSLRPYFS
jgi:hypothetical protein